MRLNIHIRPAGVVAVMSALGLAGCGGPGSTAPKPPASSPHTAVGSAPRRPSVSPTRPGRGPALWEAVAFVSPRLGFVAGPGGVLATTDGGATWTSVWNGSAPLDAVRFVDSRNGFAWGGDTLLATADGGRTWRTAARLDGTIVSLAWTSPKTGWAVVRAASAGFDPQAPGTELWATTDGGRHFAPVTVPFHPLAVGFADPSHGWAVGRHRIWRTVDGGRDWTPAYVLGPEVPREATIRPGGPDSVWIELVGDSGMSQTSYTVLHQAAGSGWSVVAAVSTAGAGPAPDAPATAPRGPGSSPGPLVAVGPDVLYLAGLCRACGVGTTAVWRTVDGGASWTPESAVYGAAGIPGTDALSFIDVRQGWLVDGTPAALFATADGGQTWHEVGADAVRPVDGITFPGPRRGFALGMPGDPNAVLATNDGGRHWAVRGTIPAGTEPWNGSFGVPALTFWNTRDGWAVRDDRLWATTDGGRSWAEVPLPGRQPSDRLTVVARWGADAVVGSDYGEGPTWWTEDGGRTWNEARNATFGATAESLGPALHRLATVAPAGADVAGGGTTGHVAWATFTDGDWATSTDGGYHWHLHTLPPAVADAGGLASMAWADAQTGWIITGTGGLVATTDGGRRWTRLDPATP